MLTFDVEATGAIKNKAKPHDPENRCVLNCWRVDGKPVTHPMEYDLAHNYLDDVQEFQRAVDDADLVVGMNIKYDMHWMRRYGINFRKSNLWDIQIYHSVTNGMKALPSLNEIAEFWNLPLKLDVVKTEYWEQGKDTDEVPFEILKEYGDHDTWLTEQIAILQLENFKKLSKNLQRTIQIKMKDIQPLFEMEWNGFYYDVDESKKRAYEQEKRIKEIHDRLDELVFGNDELRIPVNYGSTDQRSAILYGGTIKYTEFEEYLFTYKDPRKQPVTKVRKVVKERVFPRLVAPSDQSHLAKDGVFSTDEDTLKKIKTRDRRVKEIIELWLELAGLNKLVNTYFLGLPKKMEEFGWLDGFIHGSYSQARTTTGRIASSSPNMQNVDPRCKPCFKPRKKGNVVASVDAKALEWRTMVEQTQDPVGLKEIAELIDQHTLNQEAFGLPSRLISKKFLFRGIYRGPAYAYANDNEFSHLGKEKFWQNVIDRFKDKYAGIERFQQQQIQEVYARHGYYTSPISGVTYEFKLKGRKQEYNEFEIANYSNQGLGADIMALIRVILYKRLRERDLLDSIQLVATVHDSIVFDCPNDLLSELGDHINFAFSRVRDAWNSLYESKLTVPIGFEATVGVNYKDEQPWLEGDGLGNIVNEYDVSNVLTTQ